ncbi:MAG: restriction endonuclease subunit S [Planctomycetota bacterium]
MADYKWVNTTLGLLFDDGIASVQTGPFGSQLHSYDYVEQGVRVVSTEAIGFRRLKVEMMPQISSVMADRLKRHRLHTGDILFARRGAQATGLSALVESEHEGFICSTGALRLRIHRPDRVDPSFLSFLLVEESSRLWLKAHAVGAVMPNLNEDVIRGLPISLPSHEEQRAIAQMLGALDDKIELNRRMNQTLEALARAMFKSWFVDFDPVVAKAAGKKPVGMSAQTAALFPDCFQDSTLGPIPKGWLVARVGDEFRLTMGQSPPGGTYNEEGNGAPFFQGRTDFTFRFPARRVYCTAPTRFADPQDTLVSVRAPVGDINMAIERCAVGRGVAGVRHKSGSRSFTYYAMGAFADAFATFDGDGTLFGSIGKTDFEGIQYVSPPDELICRFNTTARPLDDRIEQNERQSAWLASLRDALLPQLMSGELRVKQAEKLVAQAV